MLDYRVHTFLALYEEMNYRRTAEKLNMTQPGVTQHIHYLEKYYGIKLFEYDGRTLSRTRQAEALKRFFDSIKAEEMDMRSQFSPGDKVHIRIGATKTIGEFVIVPEIRAFLCHPLHSIDLMIDNTEHLLHMLENAEIDFAIIEGVFDKTRYGYHLYKEERFVGVCSNTHPFAGKIISLDDAFLADIVVRERGSGTRRILEQAIENRGFSLGCFHRCIGISNFSVICELVAKDNYITFAYEPISMCRDDFSTFEVKDMQIKGEFNFVYCNERRSRDKIGRIFGCSTDIPEGSFPRNGLRPIEQGFSAPALDCAFSAKCV